MQRATLLLIVLVGLVACAPPTPTPTLTPTATPIPTPTLTPTPTPVPTNTPTPTPVLPLSYYYSCSEQEILDGFGVADQSMSDNLVVKVNPNSVEELQSTPEEVLCRATIEISLTINGDSFPIRQDTYFYRLYLHDGVFRAEVLEEGEATNVERLELYAGQFCNFISAFLAFEEMAEADLTWGEALPHIKDANKELKEASPPVLLEDFHQVLLWFSDSIVMIVESKTPWEGIDDRDSDIESVIDRGISRIDDAMENLSEDALYLGFITQCEDFGIFFDRAQ